MYFYESHMGGIYATDKELSYEEIYCEGCGDSDWPIGCANNINEAWQLLKSMTDTFDYSKCNGCPHEEDYDYCDNKCENYQSSGGYKISYVTDLLYSAFNPKHKNYFVLIAKHKDCNDKVFVNIKPNGHEFGSAHTIPMIPVLDSSFNFASQELAFIVDEYVEDSLSLMDEKTINGNTYKIYTCLTNESGDWAEGAHYQEDGWYAFMDISDVKEKLIGDKDFVDYIKSML